MKPSLWATPVFANRCIRKFEELREKKTTVLFVSHDLGLVKQLSNRAIFLLNGRIEAEGEPKHVIDNTSASCWSGRRHFSKPTAASTLRLPTATATDLAKFWMWHCWANRAVPAALFPAASGSPSGFALSSGRRSTSRWWGILIRNRIGMEIYGTNTRIEQVNLGNYDAGEELVVEFQFECWLTPQHYTITVATQYADGSSHDWLDDVISFEVLARRQAAGVADLRANIEWRKSKVTANQANENASHA